MSSTFTIIADESNDNTSLRYSILNSNRFFSSGAIFFLASMITRHFSSCHMNVTIMKQTFFARLVALRLPMKFEHLVVY